MELYQGIILGILQGLTEFLPVSSSGHLVLGQIFFGITESQLIFDVSVHVGTLLAVVVVYASDIRAIIVSVFEWVKKGILKIPVSQQIKEDEHLKLAFFIAIGSIPTAAIGLLLKQFEHVLFSSQILVGVMLVLTGTILWVSRNFYFNDNRKQTFGALKALVIGFSQGLAVIPGISRSGTTIAVGMFLGLDRRIAAKFSFLLSVPAIIGAEILSIKDIIKGGITIDPVIIYATIVSFIVGLIALKILLSLVHAGRFHLFAPYCWLVGALVLLSKII